MSVLSIKIMKFMIFLTFIFYISSARGEVFIPKNWNIKEIPTIETNIKNIYKGRVNKCEKEGVNDIYALNSPFEEFWAYIPEKCVWLELGILEQVTKQIRRDSFNHCRPPNTISGIKKSELISLIKRVNSITLFHPHPANKILVAHLAGLDVLNNYSESCRREASIETLEAALPSLPDLASMFQFSRIFYHFHPNGKFSEKIVSTYGVTEYRLSPLGFRKLKTKDSIFFQRQEMQKYFHLRKQFPRVVYKDEKSLPQNTEKLQELITIINDEITSFRISFTPKNIVIIENSR